MRYRGTRFAAGVVAVLALACATEQQLLAQKQETAMNTALQRGRFDLGCQTATATLLSSDFIQPAIAGPFLGGIERLEYTVGVAGCDKRTTYVVMCQQSSDTCFAAHPDSHLQPR